MTTRDASVEVVARCRLDSRRREAPHVSPKGDAVNLLTAQRMAEDSSDRASGAAAGRVGLLAFKFRLYPSPEAARLLERYAAAERAIFNRVVEYQCELRDLQQRRRRHGGRMGLPRAEFDYRGINAWADSGGAVAARRFPEACAPRPCGSRWRAVVDSFAPARAEGRPRFRRRGGGTDGFSWQAATFVRGGAQDQQALARGAPAPRPTARRVVWCRVRVDTGAASRPSAPTSAGKLLRITCDAAGTWWLTMTAPSTPKPAAPAGSSCGLDLGVVHTLTLADDTGRVLHLKMPRLHSDDEARRLVESAALPEPRPASPTRADSGRAPTRAGAVGGHVAPLPESPGEDRGAAPPGAAPRRHDWIEKVTTHIADRYQLVGVEDLSVRALTASAAGTVEAPGRNVAAKTGLNRANWRTAVGDDPAPPRGQGHRPGRTARARPRRQHLPALPPMRPHRRCEPPDPGAVSVAWRVATATAPTPTPHTTSTTSPCKGIPQRVGERPASPQAPRRPQRTPRTAPRRPTTRQSPSPPNHPAARNPTTNRDTQRRRAQPRRPSRRPSANATMRVALRDPPGRLRRRLGGRRRTPYAGLRYPHHGSNTALDRRDGCTPPNASHPRRRGRLNARPPRAGRRPTGATRQPA